MDDIVYFDRYSRQYRTELVYGDQALRWTYGTRTGRLALATVVRRAFFSHWYGWRMDQPQTRERVAPFIMKYGLDADEFVKAPEQFESFNDFFARKLRPEARPIDSASDGFVFPADGRHLCVPDLSQAGGLFIKGQMFDLATLLDDDSLTDRYRGGSLLLSRLCPTDYHRFHFPCAGTAGPCRLINGPLYSVNPIALRKNIQILATNKRTITELRTDHFGTVLQLEIGATCVGSIRQTYAENAAVQKGDEKGYFRFGGSSTITIFEPGRVQFDEDLVEQSGNQCELYAKMGDHAGSLS
ncbi:archaetidylserine decarboxylase [Rhodopirellula sp. MGV]|uniref:archaetidylserine decarboxylase n=1 Tax=Rhodopirellula sp. MGV TaxID=2023130 RepID=UPI000B9745F3|nr:archaetidylserine decarboxylase [Rhodopirellula sp. MGV]OYP38863.1 phosphatidylserine decarboxylase [Rhodopirellula sp. MGV]PNY37673.1 phosphatidylserine decarboxylase [Rhodopirellula baltica]